MNKKSIDFRLLSQKVLVKKVGFYLTIENPHPLPFPWNHYNFVPKHKRTEYLLPNNERKVKVKEIFEIFLDKDLLFKINERKAALVTFPRKKGTEDRYP